MLGAASLVFSVGGLGAIAANPAAPAAAAGTAAVETAREHYAKGEVKYEQAWVPIEKLFKDYLAGRHELDAAAKRVDAVRDQLGDLQRELAATKGEVSETERPIRADLSKARNRLRECSRTLSKQPPAKPRLKDIPSAPRISDSGSSDHGGSSGYGHGSNNNSSSDNARQMWREKVEVIKQQNDQATKKYQQEMASLQKEQAAARAEVPKLESTIKQCEEKLKKLGADLETKQAPTLNQTLATNEEVRAENRKTEVLEGRVEDMAKALRAAPEDVRLRNGIVEFEGRFYSAYELQQTHKTTQAEIDAVREQLKAESDKAGLPFPENWRHPQQDRMDAIKRLVEKVQVAREAAAKEAAAAKQAAKPAKAPKG
jgi:chromosome segregation ATPase